MLVMEHQTGRMQYEAAELNILKNEYEKLWKEIDRLVNQEMTTEEVFYYAAFIHHAMVNIHPFGDGNGRIARLLEKWFLAEKCSRTIGPGNQGIPAHEKVRPARTPEGV